MRTRIQFFNFFTVAFLCGMLFTSCSSDEPDVAPEQETLSDTLTVEDLDDFSGHLKFLGATKKEGKAPAAANSSTLKFSIKDTLRLFDGVPTPIKFLHDKNTNVAGVYIQIQNTFIGGSAGTFATHYYDVPEVPETADSDTVSIVIIGFDPGDLELPLPFHITITPTGPSGEPLDETVVPVVVEDINDPKNSGSGSCGLVLPQGDYWDWFLSHDMHGGDTYFWAEPNTIFGGDQIIKGCCVEGNSDYGGTCLQGDPLNERTLPFSTYYQIVAETFTFSNDGTFTRITQENSANPLPDESDFCNGDVGVVDVKQSLITYQGNWTLKDIAVPRIYPSYTATRDYLTLQVTTSTSPGGGYGNPGGIIHALGCFGLVLIQVDKEGGDRHLHKFYERKRAGEDEWYLLHK